MECSSMPEISFSEVMMFKQRFYTTKLSCQKSILDLSNYDDIAMWWIADSLFHNYLSNIIAGVSRATYINSILIKTYKYGGEYGSPLYDMALRTISGVFGLKKYIKGKKVVIFTTDNLWGMCCYPQSKESIKSDRFFDSIMRVLYENYDLLSISAIDTSPIGGIKTTISKNSEWYIPHTTLNYYWSLHAWKEQNKAYRHFKKMWKCIENDEIFKEICVFKGESLYPSLKYELEFYFIFLFPLAVKYICMGKSMIDREKPDLILLKNEYGWRERSSLVIPSKLKNIPILALQHGVIHPSHEGYMYPKKYISSDGNVNFPYCPIPDKIAVYGQYHYDLLSKSGTYRSEDIIITGQPRYDILSSMQRIYSKKEFLKTHQINTDHRIVLWTTQCHGLDDRENKKNFASVFRAIKNIEDVTLIIKQHPREPTVSPKYAKEIKRYISYCDLSSILMPASSDTFELLNICDLLIVKDSTTAMEAIALNKPIIVLNLSEKQDRVDYVGQGVALGIYNDNDLEPAIRKLLIDDSELSVNRSNYVRNYLYKIDGAATDRVKNVITNILNQKS